MVIPNALLLLGGYPTIWGLDTPRASPFAGINIRLVLLSCRDTAVEVTINAWFYLMISQFVIP